MISRPPNDYVPPKSPPVPEPEAIEPESKELGGRKGPDPVRYGDWEKNGIAIDF